MAVCHYAASGLRLLQGLQAPELASLLPVFGGGVNSAFWASGSGVATVLQRNPWPRDQILSFGYANKLSIHSGPV